MLAGVRPAKRGESRPLTWCAKRRRPWSEHLSDEEAEDADAEETCAEQVVCEETNRPMHRSLPPARSNIRRGEKQQQRNSVSFAKIGAADGYLLDDPTGCCRALFAVI
ncbi:unnamed protein product [Durusdinium trenchii]|uniref:Uncharacterized protein n=1 Tax=Durusdinium trenchii TaxID=1381693 RepID=A0ABP0LNB6_9DINO